MHETVDRGHVFVYIPVHLIPERSLTRVLQFAHGLAELLRERVKSAEISEWPLYMAAAHMPPEMRIDADYVLVIVTAENWASDQLPEEVLDPALAARQVMPVVGGELVSYGVVAPETVLGVRSSVDLLGWLPGQAHHPGLDSIIEQIKTVEPPCAPSIVASPSADVALEPRWW